MKKMIRTKLNKKMKNFFSFPISLITAPAGFGKTTSVRFFLKDQNIHTVWFSMNGEVDEEWIYNKLLQLLKEELPFFSEYPSHIPTSRKDLDDFITNLSQKLDRPLFIIFDDMNISSVPTFMEMIKMYSFNSNKLIHFILITRDSSQFKPFTLNANSYYTLDSHDFLLSKIEVIQLWKSESLPLSPEDVIYVYNYTNGWFTATQLILESYKKNNGFHRTGIINSLIKEVFYNSLSPEVQTGLVKLSILKDFNTHQALDLCQSPETIEAIINLEVENFFVQSISLDRYCIVPILKDFLQKELLLSNIDQDSLYEKSGLWYLNNDQPLEAIKLFLKCNNFEQIIRVMQSCKDISFTDISPQLMIEVFSALPNEYKNKYPYFYLEWILDCITNLPWLNGVELLEDFKNRITHDQVVGDKTKLLGEYYFIHAFTYYNDVKLMTEDFIRAYECFDGGYSQFAHPFMIATFGSYHVLYLYYNEAGQLQNIVDEIHKKLHYFIHISKGINMGSNEQVSAELAYETGQYADVSSLAIVAYNKALSKMQTSIAISSLFLQGRLALIQFNQQKFKIIIKELETLLTQTTIPILLCEIECALSHLHILNNQPNLVYDWLKEGDFDHSAILHEAGLIAPIVHGLYLIKAKNYEKLDMIADIIENSNIKIIHVFGIIYAKLYKTISCYERNFIAEAIQHFNEVLQICSKDQIISPIIELAFAFEGLLDCYIAENSFETHVIQTAKEHLIKYHSIHTHHLHNYSLTSKELIVLSMVAKNKTLKTIANELHISINTVQTHMKSIYRKLNINTKVEAIQYYEKMNNK